MQTCKVCEHAERGIIEAAMKRGITLAALARRHDVSEDSLSRHRAEHVSDNTPIGNVDPGDLLATLIANRDAAADLAATAEEETTRVSALREVRQNTEAIARLTGANNKANLKNLIPFWAKLRAAILEALRPYPEARRAVLDALETAETSGS